MLTMRFYLISIFIIHYVKTDAMSTRSLLSIKYPLTREDAIKNFKDRSDFVFDFYNPRPIDIIDGAPSGLTVRAKGSNFPMLINNGLSMSLSTIYPCGIVLPHLHPRASQIYFILKGKLEMGFIEENGVNYTGQMIQEGQGTIFPQGAIHYFMNNQCTNASLVAVANNEDPGRIDIATNFLNVLPRGIVRASLGSQKLKLNKNLIQAIDPAKGTKRCRRQCGID